MDPWGLLADLALTNMMRQYGYSSMRRSAGHHQGLMGSLLLTGPLLCEPLSLLAQDKTPDVAYVMSDGDIAPLRVRTAWVGDQLIEDLAAGVTAPVVAPSPPAQPCAHHGLSWHACGTNQVQRGD